ncbi:glycosyl transferase [Phyllobacterium salinisoli]|uniref:Glycosyl transferase n=1 Tax=Phyllobacterium salinisoli TaxID=1899321 RepID=A0A368KA83_9HYPH|nr:glycosyltransferase family 25 protein [Phyllobacterium salinisoli]RCS25525.1 glycosyl transferase [Phyllobacterium salinisoli]
MKAEAFVIHLARASGRRPQAEKLLGELGLPARILDAVDAAVLSERDTDAVYRRNLHRPAYPFTLRRTEIACFLSHRKAWQAIIDQDLDAGLIVEDDVEPDAQSFAPVLRLALETIQPRDLIRFPCTARREKGPVVAEAGEVSLIAPGSPGLGMQMQLVGREAAALLLDMTRQFDRPVDTTVQMRWVNNVRILSARPICIREISGALGGTVVQNKSKTLSEIVNREVRRPLYRASVAVRNALAGPPISYLFCTAAIAGALTDGFL